MNIRAVQSLSRNTNARGFSLVEFGIVVALVAGGALFVYLAFSDRNDSAAVSAEAHNFTLMAAETQVKWRAQGGFAGINDIALINNGVVPPSMIVGGGIEARWNTPVTVVPGTLSASNDAAVFTYYVPRKSCADFVTQAGSSAAQAAADERVVKSFSAGDMNVAELGLACSGAAGDLVEVTLWVAR